MTITIKLKFWWVALIVWLVGVIVAVNNDKSTGWGAGMEGAFMALLWTLVMFGISMIYMAVFT